MNWKLFFLLLFISVGSFAQVQRKTSYNDLVWFGDFSKGVLNEKWSVYFDVGLRRSEWLNKWSQTLIRPGLTFHLNKDVSITAGAAYFNHYAESCVRPEYRGWEQLLFTKSFGRFLISHRLRAEQRFNRVVEANEVLDEFKYNNRYRYQLGLQLALNKSVIEDRTVYLSFADEIMLNSGREIAYNYFDQNRLSIGLGYKWTDLFNLTVSYMNVFIHKSQPATYEKNNVLVINVYHKFNLVRKQG
ncbi:MAG TPA: DUF2490 domain-containing protein [Bacteroidia bacterium]|jgi:hypothetical protein